MGIRLDLLHRVTDEELRELSERNPVYQFERTADGRLSVTPTGGESGMRGGRWCPWTRSFRALCWSWGRCSHKGGGG